MFIRRSILYDMPNSGSNAIRHITGVMHTEKNITEHLLNIMMGNSKSKDSPAARQDMEYMGIRKKLWLKEDVETGRTVMERGTFELMKKEKIEFCTVLKNLKVPSGFSTNLRNCVIVNPPDLRNFKSHDYHVVMQHLLPLLVHTSTSLPKDLRVSLLRINIFFNILCAKVINREHLLKAKASLVEAICVLEKHFPPSFFVISIQLMIHLADEALISGPVRFRLMKGFKVLVRNKRYIDGCIARGYTLREASLYGMEDVSKNGYDSYVNCESSNSQRNCSSKNTSDFHLWLREELLKANEANSTLWRLVHGPLFKAQSYKRYQVNGFTFCAQDYQVGVLSQNSGVSMRAVTSYRAKSTDTEYLETEMTYYGVIMKIIKLNYMEFEETVFYCDCVKVEDKTNGCKVDPNSKLIKISFSKMKSIDGALDEPFILASEAIQVFYSKDISEKGWLLWHKWR
ncbi:uncharacterized protein LOC113323636 isoform X2 [Papaver somniferum]|uniref:uncharacterized protein LOC113323636 isoform X2 n=1 Tax=Papaver somniferum TaxID=3469 RepID=UPI000E6FA269|nr:uncharacterized protein LOC113323636 isoform X2 [Papaver somniferum]